MTYEVRLSETAIADLSRLPQTARTQIVARVEALAEDPMPRHARALAGQLRGLWRLRVGDYRVGYTIDRANRVVEVWRVGKRETFYERARQLRL